MTKKARELLKKAKFRTTPDPRVEVVAKDDETMPEVLRLLIEGGVDVLDVTRLEGNLESSLLEVLKQSRIKKRLAEEQAE